MATVTFDTGALIAIESRRVGITKLFRSAQRDAILVPANAVGEWWRGDRDQREILSALTIVDVTEQIAKLAGDALATLHGRNRARRSSITGDHEDMDLFTTFFPNVRLLGLR